MSAIVGALDTQIQRLASLADNAAIPYNHVILWFSALQTYFEYYVM
jgi:hypothetical protein